MTRTVPRRVDRKGEHLSACDVCGAAWLRSSLKRGRDGLLRCPQDIAGRDEVTLAELTASRAAAISRRLGAQTPADGARGITDSNGNAVSEGTYTGPTKRTTLADVYASGVPTYTNPRTRTDLDGF